MRRLCWVREGKLIELLKTRWQRLKTKPALDARPGVTRVFTIETTDADGQLLRVGCRGGKTGVTPLLLYNGLGASLELFESFVASLDTLIPVVIFDVPGAGGSPAPSWPYRISSIARLGDRLMCKLGWDSAVDVLGFSWGGLAAQQFAHDFPDRCRRLVLVATSPGAIMVPGKLGAIAKLASLGHYGGADFLRNAGPGLYGGVLRKSPELLKCYAQHIKPSGLGYAYQLLAGTGWTSLPWLHRLRQPTLVMHGTDDPLVPLTNAKILASLIPNSTLRVIDDGHLLLLAHAAEAAQMIAKFLLESKV